LLHRLKNPNPFYSIVPVDACQTKSSCFIARCLYLICNLSNSENITRAIKPLAIGDFSMLWTIFVILLVLWLLGWIGVHALGAYIHIVLVLALVVLCIQLFSGRRAV